MFLFRRPLFVGALILALLMVGGSYFGGKWYYGNFSEQSGESVKASLNAKETADTPTITEETLSETVKEREISQLAESDSLNERSEMAEQNAADVSERLSEEEAKRKFYQLHGLTPPPEGQTYLWDGHGTARLVKYNEPLIEADWTQQNYGNFHQLSDEEFERYNALGGITHDYSELIKEGYQVPTYPADIVELAREWKAELYEKTWGPKLTILAGTVYNRDVTSEDDEKRAQLLEDKYQEFSPPSREFVVNYDVVDQLLIELKSELERR